MTTHTATEPAPWPPVPDAVWRALREFLTPYVSARFVIPGDPVPKKRRVGQGNTAFTPKRTRDAETKVRKAFREALPGWQPEPDWTFGGLVEFRTRSGSLTDIDNALKLVMDALHKVFWADDIQVGRLHLDLVRGRGEPGVEVLLFRVADNGTPKTKLCQCGTRHRSRTSKCWSCRKPKAAANKTTELEVDLFDNDGEELSRRRRKAFSYITACMIGSNVSPSIGSIAIRLGVSEPTASTVVDSLIADGHLTRTRSGLKPVKPLGDAA